MKHGHSPRNGKTSPTYKSWTNMKTRCLNPNSEKYKSYGALGVTICQRWLDSFENFLEDMGPRPAGMTLDRENPFGNYSKENCVWSTAGEQARNKRNTIKVERDGIFKTLASLAEEAGIPYDTLHDRIAKGWPIAKALKGTKALLVVNGVCKSYSAWEKELGLPRETIRGRVKAGCTPEQCIQQKAKVTA